MTSLDVNGLFDAPAAVTIHLTTPEIPDVSLLIVSVVVLEPDIVVLVVVVDEPSVDTKVIEKLPSFSASAPPPVVKVPSVMRVPCLKPDPPPPAPSAQQPENLPPPPPPKYPPPPPPAPSPP